MRTGYLAALAILFVAAPLYAQKTLGDGIEELAQQIAERSKTAHAHRIAVLPLEDLHHAQSDMGVYIAEELSTSLAIQQVDIVERGRLDHVLSELKLQQSGAFDPETAKRVGKLAGADAVVTGTITEFRTTLTVSCHVIATEDGKLITAARTKITIDSDVETLRNGDHGNQHAQPAKNDATKTVQAKETDARPSSIFQDVRITVDKAERSGDMLTLTISFELIGNQTWNGQFNEPYLLDENGERWPGRFDDGTHYAFLNLLPQTRVRRRAIFLAPQTGSAGTRFTLVSESWKLAIHDIRTN
ncbi:MAG TPA: FlgO family outer membrane protein [Thermoanaerobaculia bacterium]|nr:FlgO family outer membrane protein [Thermoanaerobaculia bacterium]